MNRLSPIYFLFILVILFNACNQQDKTKLNLGFEQLDEKGKAIGWNYEDYLHYKVPIDNKISLSGKNSIHIKNTTGAISEIPGGASLELLDLENGQKISLSGFIKTKETSSDSLGLIIVYADGAKQTSKILRSPNLVGTNDWHEYKIDLTIEGQPENVAVGAVLYGKGEIWVDDLKLYIDDKQIKYQTETKFIASNKELKWLIYNCLPLNTVEAENGFEDLQGIKELIGDSRIVALGENTHGTSEVFKMKHRLVEFLANEMDFDIFSIEANMPEAYKLNDYVLYGKGNVKELVSGMYFWTWDTQEVVDMIEWMRRFNEKGNKKIQFTGFDMQFYKVALENIEEFDKNNKEQLLNQTQTLNRIFKNNSKKWTMDKDEIQNVHQILKEITYFFESNKNTILTQITSSEYSWLIQNINILSQFVELKDFKRKELVNYRDQCMADNVSWILENNPDSKIILWAHNGHVAKTKGWMGDYLSEKYKKDYYSIGFLSNTGTYTAVKSGKGVRSDNLLNESEPGSFEYSFSKTDSKSFFFDFSKTDTRFPESQWLNQSLNYKSIGARAMENQNRKGKLRDKFDAIIYLESTTASECFRAIKSY